MSFGKNVKNLRKAKGKTLKEIADLSGIAVSYLSDIENEKKNPSKDIEARLAAALGTTIDAINGRLSQLIDYARMDRTIDKFSKDTGVDISILAELCNDSITQIPSQETLKKIAEDPTNILVDYIELLEAAGYYDRKARTYQTSDDTDYRINESSISYKPTTLAAHRTDGYDNELPPEAQKELQNYIDYLKVKYKKKDTK